MKFTTMKEVKAWFDKGQALGATHMIVVCDQHSFEDYPVYVQKSESVFEVEKKYDGVNMQRVMEVYNLSKDRDSQLVRGRCFEY